MVGGSTTDCGTVSSAPSPGQRRRPRRLPWQRSRESRGPAGTRADGSSLLNYHTEAEVGGADEVRGTSARGGHGDRAGAGRPCGSLTTRLRLFHQSSHLGDEYMAHTNARRIDLTFQAVELLVARETTRWRLYGGGDYIFAHSPTDLKPGVLHGGLEFRQPASLLRLGRGAAGRFVAGLGVEWIQERGWQGGGGGGARRGGGGA